MTCLCPHGSQVSWGAMVQAANVSQMLQSSSNLFTVFAPVDSAIQVAIENDLMACQTQYYLDEPCTSLQSIFNSTSLPQLVMNYGKQQSIWHATQLYLHQNRSGYCLVQTANSCR